MSEREKEESTLELKRKSEVSQRGWMDHKAKKKKERENEVIQGQSSEGRIEWKLH